MTRTRTPAAQKKKPGKPSMGCTTEHIHAVNRYEGPATNKALCNLLGISYTIRPR